MDLRKSSFVHGPSTWRLNHCFGNSASNLSFFGGSGRMKSISALPFGKPLKGSRPAGAKLGQPASLLSPSSAVRTKAAKSLAENGFWMKDTPASRTP